MKIAVTGASGFVGNKIVQMYEGAIVIPSLKNKTTSEIEKIIKESEADVLIHTAAISDVGICQARPEESYQANVMLPVIIAKSFEGGKLICFSSDQVYSGSTEIGPYTEDMAAPGNLYAEEKLEMENRVLDICPDAVMLRAEWMYDYVSNKGNYFKNILNAEGDTLLCSRQFRGVSYVKEAVEAMRLVWNIPGGSYNFGSETQKSMYEITKEFVAFLEKKIEVEEGTERHNLWMDCSKIKKYGIAFSEVTEGLKKCARDYGMEKKKDRGI